MQEQGGKPNVNDVTVKAGALYDPALLKDYSPDYFQFKRAKLVQFPYEDANKKLIAPWDVHSKLRPGTLVTIEAKMICWLNTDRMKPHTLRKNYHLQIVKVRVFADSDLPMHPLDTPKVLSPPSPESSKTPAKRELASDKFTTFSATPVKKSKK
ncbi:hypothetical protein BDQ17DRAFT_1353584 [Cyathus striatus]|nr:hypothetical protein BDQ17DRAFT_1353584 [Cyathus striatus]